MLVVSSSRYACMPEQSVGAQHAAPLLGPFRSLSCDKRLQLGQSSSACSDVEQAYGQFVPQLSRRSCYPAQLILSQHGEAQELSRSAIKPLAIHLCGVSSFFLNS